MEIENRDHILHAIKWLSLRKVAPTKAAILYTEFVTNWEKDEQLLDAVLEDMVSNGLIILSEEAYSLTPEGSRLAQQNVAQEFGKWMITCEQSLAFRKLCKKLYGSDRCQFNMLSQSQLEKLLDVLNISKRQSILDVGCGTGALIEYISDHTQGNVTGIDFSSEAIQFAQERMRGKHDRLSFQVMDMDDLTLPSKTFDTVLSIDTLYFVNDLHKTIHAIRDSLQQQGQMGIFYSAKIASGEPKELLRPENTALAKALENCGMTFKTWDFTAAEEEMWRRAVTIVNELKDQFVDEGNLAIYEGRISEATRELEFLNTGRKRRYLFHAWI
jgi:ubiquinone/menaquinone biosynthesis C-methylase UbiE